MFTDKELEELNKKNVDAKDIQNVKADHNRRHSYPEIGEQLEMLWHAIDDGTLDKNSDFYKSLKKVKDDNPKAE